MEKHMHWNIVGAKTITHPLRRVPTSMGSHETPPQNTEVGTPLISTHPVVCDNKQQHGNVQRRTVPDNKRCTINHQAILLFCPTYSSFSLISNMLFILISFFSFSFLHPLSSPLALFSCSWNLPFSPLAKHTLNINVKK